MHDRAFVVVDHETRNRHFRIAKHFEFVPENSPLSLLEYAGFDTESSHTTTPTQRAHPSDRCADSETPWIGTPSGHTSSSPGADAQSGASAGRALSSFTRLSSR